MRELIQRLDDWIDAEVGKQTKGYRTHVDHVSDVLEWLADGLADRDPSEDGDFALQMIWAHKNLVGVLAAYQSAEGWYLVDLVGVAIKALARVEADQEIPEEET